MPIRLSHSVDAISEQAFHKLDYSVMAMAFEVHNQLGRFYDEKIYQNRLREMCCKNQLTAESEFEVNLTHGDYSKSLFIDLLINNSAAYELKTIQSIQEPQRMQTLDYLFTTDTHHGKIINFRPPSVEHEFISTSLNNQSRHSFSVCEKEWSEHSEQATQIKNILSGLLHDWGAFLNTTIYEEAIYHFLGGKDSVVQPVEIRIDSTLGHQKIPMLSKHETFRLTSVTKNIPAFRTHLSRFLSHTGLDHLYWINFNRFKIQLSTLSNKSFCP